jgi:hypothetical protein
MRHDSGLAASPPVRHILGVERRQVSPFACPPGTRTAKQRRGRARYRGARKSVGLQMRPPNDEFFSSANLKVFVRGTFLRLLALLGDASATSFPSGRDVYPTLGWVFFKAKVSGPS